MTELQALILGTLQGLTEFFPVSSSGHLVLGQTFFNIKEEVLLFDIFVHLGSLFAVMIVFRKSILTMLDSTFRGCWSIACRKESAGNLYRTRPELRVAAAIVIGTLPAVVVGLAFKDGIEQLFHSAGAVFLAMGFTGIVLLGTFMARPGTRPVGILAGLLIGMAQAVAITPGISRSGMTIASALFLGVKRDTAGEFSFLLSIPAILGATVFAAKDLFEQGAVTLTAGAITAGVAASFVSGWISLVLLMGVVRKGKLGYFGYYCLAVSLAGIILLTHAG